MAAEKQGTGFEYDKKKDETPENTVRRILDCLARIGIQCGVTFFEQDVEDCYSCRVYVQGPLSGVIGANGKGTTREYCLASGFAELMERIQNQIFICQIQPRDELSPYRANRPREASLCRMAAVEDMIRDKDSFLNHVIGRYTKTMDRIPGGFDKEQLVWAQLRKLFPLWEWDGIPTLPFYNVRKGSYEWIPVELVKSLNMSNGMAAGNTLEEALVQGYSELLERYVQRQIMEGNVTPPEISREELKDYPYIHTMIEKIEGAGPYRVLVRDCSMGKGFPVVCAVVMNQKKQSFGVRFGAHPHMQIALERVFTEALQGKRLEEFTQINQLSYDRSLVNSQQNMFNTMKTGTGYYPPGLIEGKPLYEHTPWPFKEDESNRELAARMTETVLKETDRLYILDVSYLGFPSICIYGEGISELMPWEYTVLKANAMKKQVASFLQDIKEMDETKVERLLVNGKLIRNSVLENTIGSMCELPISYSFHGGNDQIGFLMAVCRYYLGDYTGAIKELESCMKKNERQSEEYQYLSALHKLLRGTEAGMLSEEIRRTLVKLCGEDLAARVWDDFSDRKGIFWRLYPFCNQFRCRSCKQTDCGYEALRDFYGVVYKELLESKVMTSRLHQLFIPSIET